MTVVMTILVVNGGQDILVLCFYEKTLKRLMGH